MKEIDDGLFDRLASLVRPQADSAPAMQPSAGLFMGRYEILDEVGRGGMGVIYRARDRTLGRLVAIKTIRTDRGLDPRLLQRARQEALAVARLKDPNIPAIYDFGESAGAPFLVFELIEGFTLAEMIARGPLAPRKAAEILEIIARSLHHAHRQGFIHRDVKPANIKIDPHGKPYILDFGLVHLVGGEEGLTATGAALGTPFYMAPEQVLGRRDGIDGRTDVYALGATLHEALTGRPAFHGQNAAEVVHLILRVGAPAPSRLAPSTPADLDTITLKALEREPQDRYRTAEDLAADLRRFLDGQSIEAKPQNFMMRAWKRARGRPALLGVGGAVAGILLVAAAWIYHVSTQGTKTQRDFEASANLSGAFHEMSLRTLVPLQILEDEMNGAVPAEPREKCMADIDSAVRATARKYPEVRSLPAWNSLAQFLAGNPDGLRQLRAACDDAKDDAVPFVLLARAHLADYARASRLGDVRFCSQRLVFPPTPFESPESALSRTAADRAIRDAARQPLWGRLRLDFDPAALVNILGLLSRSAFDKAAQELESLTKDPTLGTEAAYLKGLALCRLGKYGEAAQNFELVARRGWVNALEGAGIARLASAFSTPEESPVGEFQKSLAHLKAARIGRPTSGRILATMGYLLGEIGNLKFNDGLESNTCFLEAQKLLREGLRCEPANPMVRIYLASTLTRQAYADSRRNLDPIPRYDEAIRMLEEMLPAGPDEGWVHAELGFALRSKAGDLLARQRPCLVEFDRALAAMDRAVELDDSGGQEVRHQRALTQCEKGAAENLNGRDGSSSFAKGLAEIEELLRKNPENFQLWLDWSDLLVDLADLAQNRGEDPRKHCDTLLGRSDALLKAAPKSFNAFFNLGAARFFRGLWQATHGQDGGPDLEEALRDLTRSIEINSNYVPARFYRGWVHMICGTSQFQHGQDGTSRYELAISDLRSVFRWDRSKEGYRSWVGSMFEQMNRWKEAVVEYEAALKFKPDNAELQQKLENARERAKR